MRLPLTWLSCVNVIRLNGVYIFVFILFFNIRCRSIEFSFSAFSGLVLLLCLLLSPSFLIRSRHFSFSLPIFRCPLTSIFYDLITIHLHQSFFPHDLIISVSLLLCLTYVCHTCLCSYFFIPDLLNPRYSHHPCQHSHFCYS